MFKKLLLVLTMVLMIFALTVSAAEKKTYNWKLVETYPTGIPWHDTALHFADTVEKITDGQIKIKVYPAGAIVPAFQVFDAVRNRVAEMGFAWPGYWKGKDQAFVAFASVPFGMNNLEFST